MNVIRLFVVSFTLLLFPLLLVGCLEIDSSPSSSSVKAESIILTPSNGSTDTVYRNDSQFSFSGKSSFGANTSMNSLYVVDRSAYNTQGVSTLNDNSEIYYQNCGAGGFYTCNTTISATCTLEALGPAPTDNVRISCGQGVGLRSITVSTGQKYLVFEVCIWDIGSSINEKCSRKTFPFVIQ